MAKPTKGPFVYLDPKGKRVPIGQGVTVHEAFTVKYEIPVVGDVELDVTTRAGASRVTTIRITEPAGEKGVKGVSLASISVADLLAGGVDAAAWITSGGAGSTASRASAGAAARRKPDQSRLAEVAEAYRLAGIPGIEALHVSKRHAYRLRDLAVDAGLLDDPKGR